MGDRETKRETYKDRERDVLRERQTETKIGKYKERQMEIEKNRQ